MKMFTHKYISCKDGWKQYPIQHILYRSILKIKSTIEK